MTLANMRQNGVRMVTASCAAAQRAAQRRTPIDLGQQSMQINHHTRPLNPHPAVRNHRRQHPLEARPDLRQKV
jgi:hypothetical protein